MSCVDKQFHTFWAVFQPHMSSSLALASSLNSPGCIMKRSSPLAIDRLDPHSQLDQIRSHLIIAQVASLGEWGSCQLALNFRICAFGIEIVHDVEFPLESCEVNWRSVLVLSMVDVDLCLLHEKFDDLEVKALDCVEDWGLFFLIQQLEVASQFQQEPQCWDVGMNGSKVGQVKAFLNAFIYRLRICQAYSLHSLQVITLNSREKLGIGQPLILDSLDDSVELSTEYQRVEFVLEVLFKLIVEVRVKLYEKGHQFL